MSSGPSTQTTTQQTTLPPQYQQAFTSILNQANALQPQPTYGTRTVMDDYNFNLSDYGLGDGSYSYQAPRVERYQTGMTGGVTDITPDQSYQTRRGLQLLTSGPDSQAVGLLRDTAAGKFQNPYTNVSNVGVNNAAGRTGIEGVTDAITQAATRAVSDRFSQAGRGGSGAEGMALAGEVSRQLAPFAFNANENALSRGFTARENQLGRNLTAQEAAADRGFRGFENERARQLSTVPALMGLNPQRAQQFLQAGQIIEDQQREQLLEPFNLFNLRTDPLIRALGGAPTTTTTTQPVNRNRAAGVLGGAATGAGIASALSGGAATGAGIASALSLSNPFTAAAVLGGGLLGGY